MKDGKRNSENYYDLTAWQALRNIESEERAKKLVAVLRYIITQCGFELLEPIHLRDKKTDREYK